MQTEETYSAALAPQAEVDRGVRAWDLPTRLFKWSLVALLVAAWFTHKWRDPVMSAHKLVGYAILTLVLWRVLWGFVGGGTARFSAFVRSPKTILAYLRRVRENRARPYLGHNPAGGLMIVLLLGACGVQALLGLCASDGVLAAGPWADGVGDTLSMWASRLHGWWFYGILGLAAVHVAANLYYQFVKGENLIGAMVTGRKRPAAYQDGRAATPGSPLVAVACLLVAAAIVYVAVVVLGTGWNGDA